MQNSWVRENGAVEQCEGSGRLHEEFGGPSSIAFSAKWNRFSVTPRGW